MGLFDFLKKSSSPPPAGGDRKINSLGKVVGDKRAQTYDRTEAIRELASIATAEAVEALLKRFTFSMDPSITDQEEKESTFEAIVAAGEVAVEPVRAFCGKAEVLTWPLRILREVLDDDAYREQLLALADGFDTDYTRNVEPKLQVIGALEEMRGDEVRECVERFLDDVNETVRFHAVQTTFAQSREASIGALLALFGSEESVRIKNKVCDGFIQKAWKVPESSLDEVNKALSDVTEFALSNERTFLRR